MARLVACPRCNAYVELGERRCPHCDAPFPAHRSLGPTAGALLLGLSLAGCTGWERSAKQQKEDGVLEVDALYGLPENDDETGLAEPRVNEQPPAAKQVPPPPARSATDVELDTELRRRDDSLSDVSRD